MCWVLSLVYDRKPSSQLHWTISSRRWSVLPLSSFYYFFLWESKAMKLIVECSSKIVCDKNGFSKFPTFLGTYTILRIPYYNPLFLLFSPWNVFFLPARVDMSTICYVSELSERSPQLWGTERSEKHRQAKLWTQSEDFLLPFILDTFPLLHSTSTYCKSPNVLKKKERKKWWRQPRGEKN